MTDAEKKVLDEEVVVESVDVEVGTMEDVDAIMKKFDRESNTRVWEGTPKLILRYVLAAFMLFMVYMNLWATWSGQIRRCLFVGFVILFTFFIYPVKKGNVKPNSMPWYDILLAVAGCIPYFYYVANFKRIVAMGIAIGQTEVILGIIGTPISVCSTYIALFLLFGAFLEATGVANFFIDCANALVGWASGGPAKVAVVSSALCGMVSGSSVGNTVTTGSVTIPMMKRTGYPPEFAGAVEAASSTGGQIMPPIMGAAAFIMAEMTGYEYADIIVRAILPAFLYFLGIFLGVHFKAKKLGLVGLKREELPKWKLLLPKIYLLLPLIVLTWMVVAGQTMAKSAIYGTIVAIVVGIINKDDRMTPSKFVNGLENGGKNCLSIGIACGIAGIISVCITMTGLGGKLITYVVKLSGGNLFIALFLTMICCIILGMGVPTTANYIIMASTCAPILINGMNMHILAANMFVFYFGIVADITPPVALAAYAGAAIAKAPPMKTALNATRLAIAAFIIPYIFAYNNAMIFVGDVTFFGVASIVISATLGMASIASGFMGYLIHDLKWYSRIALIAGGLLMVIPGTVTDLAGLAILIVILLIQRAENKKEKKAAV